MRLTPEKVSGKRLSKEYWVQDQELYTEIFLPVAGLM
jgi:hypothetical protein